MNKCLECGKKLPKENFQDEEKRIPTRSFDLSRIDPDMFFCTLRCAAKYGVRKAEAINKKQGN